MQGTQTGQLIYGTDEPASDGLQIAVGDLSLIYEHEAIRTISWRGIETVRAIAWPMRDPSWVTLQQQVLSESVDEQPGKTTVRLEFSVADGALHCELTITATADGVIETDLAMTAKTEFRTNRAGFTVLHPLKGVTGERLTIRHPDGAEEETVFPVMISPGQPAFAMTGMHHSVSGVDVDIAFSGEIFEMEDQRNWSDASFKTYCRPLVFPFTYSIAAGETVRQSISVKMSGNPETSGATAAGERLELLPCGQNFPQIGLALEEDWLCAADSTALVEMSGVRLLQLRIGPDAGDDLLAAAGAMANTLDAEIDAEIVIPDGSGILPALENIAARLQKNNISPARVTVLPEAYLSSYQPSGPWPDGPTPHDAVTVARQVFPQAAIGCGMLSNFTEFNRCRPDPSTGDFITHGTTAIVHAADDRSVIETLEALPQIFTSASDLGAGKPYRLGLVSIGMRSNPYGAGVAHNPDQIRQAMAMFDPRQRGLFAAAWTVGALAATQDSRVEALSPAGPCGPFGIVAGRQPVPNPTFDTAPDALVYPLFHVVRAAAVSSGRARCRIAGLPDAVHGCAVQDGESTKLLIANLGARDATLRLPDAARHHHILDESSFDAAIRDPAWLDRPPSKAGAEITLRPFAVAFATSAGS